MSGKTKRARIKQPVKPLKQQQSYGNLVSLNTSRLLLDSVGKKKIADLVKSYLKLLDTAAAAYEANGNYAARFFSSEWCQLLDNASRNLCHTKDNKKALSCGKWLCHESCWKNSKKAIETGKPVDMASACGLRLYAVPIIANGKSVGAIYFCYQDPPKDEKKLKKLAVLFKCSYADLKKASANYKSKPLYVVEAAKRHLKVSAELIGLVIEHRLTLADLNERIKELELLTHLSQILRKHFYEPVDALLKKIIYIVPGAFRNPADVCVRIIYNNAVFQTKNFKKATRCLKEEVGLGDHGKLKIEIFDLKISSIKRCDVDFLNEKRELIHNFIQLISEVILRKSAEKELRESLEKFKSIFEIAGDGIAAIDSKTKQFVFVNPRMCEVTGYSLGELLEMHIWDIHPAKNKSYVERQYKLQVEGKQSLAENLPVLRKNGSLFFCDVNAKITEISGRKYLVGFFRDITSRLELENTLKIKSRRVAALSQINQALVHAKNEKDFLKKVCHVLVSVGEYSSAWIGFVERGVNKTIRPVATFSFSSNAFKKINFTWAKKGCGNGPIGRAVREAKTVYTNSFLEDRSCAACFDFAKKHSYSSLISLPLKEKKKVYGVLNIYSIRKDAFDVDEVYLLEEIAGDLSYGIAQLKLAEEKKTADIFKEKIAIRLRKSLEDTISIISKATEKRDPYTAGHQNRVAQLSVAIAKKLNLSEDILEGIYFGSLIHDIGKIYVPAEILTRPGKLAISELVIVREHPRIGYDIVKGIDFIWPIKDIILHHHERLNGSGYPEKLKGKAISIECRIIAVADVVEAMNSHRPYRATLGIEAALNEIKKNRGKLYDPKVVDACVELFKEGFSFET